MDTQKLLNADYLDIVFDNRNKKYGGYELRKNYNKRMMKAMLLLLLVVGTLSSFSLINRDHTVASGTFDKPMKPTVVDVTPPKPKVVLPHNDAPPPPPPPAQLVKTKVFSAIITDSIDVPVDKTLVDSKPFVAAHPGFSSVGDDPNSTGIIPSTSNDKPTGVVTNSISTNVAVKWVEQMPQFAGDMNGYINKSLRYPEAARSAGIEGQVIIEFVINEDGAVSNAKAVRTIGGGCDEEAIRMVSSMPKWKPGKQNGMPVKVMFALPIKFVLN